MPQDDGTKVTSQAGDDDDEALQPHADVHDDRHEEQRAECFGELSPTTAIAG